jgi:hypothetical protein
MEAADLVPSSNPLISISLITHPSAGYGVVSEATGFSERRWLVRLTPDRCCDAVRGGAEAVAVGYGTFVIEQG